jgi:L-aspartate semialdehyde sulfurtransferase ferredoxin
MPSKTKPASKGLAASNGNGKQQTRLWLMYPPKLIKEPLLWQLAQKFPVVTNIRQASITDEIGIVSLELDGKRSDIKAAIKWLEKIGVSVEPVEINIIES